MHTARQEKRSIHQNIGQAAKFLFQPAYQHKHFCTCHGDELHHLVCRHKYILQNSEEHLSLSQHSAVSAQEACMHFLKDLHQLFLFVTKRSSLTSIIPFCDKKKFRWYGHDCLMHCACRYQRSRHQVVVWLLYVHSLSTSHIRIMASSNYKDRTKIWRVLQCQKCVQRHLYTAEQRLLFL